MSDTNGAISGKLLFLLHATKGLPLGFALAAILDRGASVNLPEFISSAVENGWGYKQIIQTIETHLADAGRAGDITAVLTASRKYLLLNHPVL